MSVPGVGFTKPTKKAASVGDRWPARDTAEVHIYSDFRPLIEEKESLPHSCMEDM